MSSSQDWCRTPVGPNRSQKSLKTIEQWTHPWRQCTERSSEIPPSERRAVCYKGTRRGLLGWKESKSIGKAPDCGLRLERRKGRTSPHDCFSSWFADDRYFVLNICPYNCHILFQWAWAGRLCLGPRHRPISFFHGTLTLKKTKKKKKKEGTPQCHDVNRLDGEISKVFEGEKHASVSIQLTDGCPFERLQTIWLSIDLSEDWSFRASHLIRSSSNLQIVLYILKVWSWEHFQSLSIIWPNETSTVICTHFTCQDWSNLHILIPEWTDVT